MIFSHVMHLHFCVQKAPFCWPHMLSHTILMAIFLLNLGLLVAPILSLKSSLYEAHQRRSHVALQAYIKCSQASIFGYTCTVASNLQAKCLACYQTDCINAFYKDRDRHTTCGWKYRILPVH